MEKETKGTKENYTHVRFHYTHGGKLTISKWTHEHVYSNEGKKPCVTKIEYIIRSD